MCGDPKWLWPAKSLRFPWRPGARSNSAGNTPKQVINLLSYCSFSKKKKNHAKEIKTSKLPSQLPSQQTDQYWQIAFLKILHFQRRRKNLRKESSQNGQSLIISMCSPASGTKSVVFGLSGLDKRNRGAKEFKYHSLRPCCLATLLPKLLHPHFHPPMIYFHIYIYKILNNKVIDAKKKRFFVFSRSSSNQQQQVQQYFFKRIVTIYIIRRQALLICIFISSSA